MVNPKSRIQNPKLERRRLLQFSLGFLLFGSFSVSCSKNQSASEPLPAKDSRFKIALVVPRSREDDTWSQSGYQGLQLIEQELGAQVAYMEKADELPSERLEQVFRQYANEGFHFIIGQGGQFKEPLEKVAVEFPRTKFALVGGYPGNQRNFGALGFRTTDLGYLFGAIAGLKTQTQNVAMIGGLPLPDYLDMAKAFERGVKATKANIQVSIEWVNSFDDPETAKQIAKKIVAEGADAILVYCGKSNPTVVEIAAAEGVYVLPIDEETRDKLPAKTVLTIGVLKMPILLLEGARLAQKGQWEGKQYRFGFEKEAIAIAPFQETLTSEQKAKINTLKQDIIAGKIDVSP
jgi:basic membrane protein A and related proteins